MEHHPNLHWMSYSGALGGCLSNAGSPLEARFSLGAMQKLQISYPEIAQDDVYCVSRHRGGPSGFSLNSFDVRSNHPTSLFIIVHLL